MRTFGLALTLLAAMGAGAPAAAPAQAAPAQPGGGFPLALTLDAQAKTATATVASSVMIQVDRLMEESRRMRVADALRYGGYANFLNTLRAIPAVGTIQVGKRTVDIRYARELTDAKGRRLVLVADRPLFFLSADPNRSRAGYELTVVELTLAPSGGATGTMAGAARVKPAGNEIVLDDFAEEPVRLTSR
jgi:hypothetical protein